MPPISALFVYEHQVERRRPEDWPEWVRDRLHVVNGEVTTIDVAAGPYQVPGDLTHEQRLFLGLPGCSSR